MTTATITAPQKGEQDMQVTGTIAWFQIGNQKVKFLIQKNREWIGPQLTHYASGFTCIPSNVIKSKKIHSFATTCESLTTREAIRQCLGDLEKRVGLSDMITKFASAPIINR